MCGRKLPAQESKIYSQLCDFMHTRWTVLTFLCVNTIKVHDMVAGSVWLVMLVMICTSGVCRKREANKTCHQTGPDAIFQAFRAAAAVGRLTSRFSVDIASRLACALPIPRKFVSIVIRIQMI